MKPEDVVIGQRYAIIDNTGDESLERFLRGTNRVVKIVRRADYTSKAFIAEHYGYPIYSERIKCWVPGVGELAEFSDGGNKWSGPHAFDGYLPNGIYSFRITGGVGFKYARPVQKKATTSRMRPETIIKLQDAIYVFKNREKNTMYCSEGYGLRYFEGRADLAAEILEMEGIKDES